VPGMRGARSPRREPRVRARPAAPAPPQGVAPFRPPARGTGVLIPGLRLLALRRVFMAGGPAH
jgi:hypothetical protein